jgi:hypothetical protein
MSELELTRAEQINTHHHACEAAVGTALKHAVMCGALLTEQKRELPHGEWGGWLEENFEGSARTAQVYMRLHRKRELVEEIQNRRPSAHLSIEGAIRALASADKDAERERKLAEHMHMANEYTEQADASFAEAKKHYELLEEENRQLVELYKTHRAQATPKLGAKMDKVRMEVEGLVKHARDEKAAMEEFVSL